MGKTHEKDSASTTREANVTPTLKTALGSNPKMQAWDVAHATFITDYTVTTGARNIKLPEQANDVAVDSVYKHKGNVISKEVFDIAHKEYKGKRKQYDKDRIQAIKEHLPTARQIWALRDYVEVSE